MVETAAAQVIVVVLPRLGASARFSGGCGINRMGVLRETVRVGAARVEKFAHENRPARVAQAVRDATLAAAGRRPGRGSRSNYIPSLSVSRGWCILLPQRSQSKTTSRQQRSQLIRLTTFA